MNNLNPDFQTSVPAAAESHAESPAQPEALNGKSEDLKQHPKTKVLIIEDDTTIRKLLDMGLRRYGYDCVAAENGRAGQTLLATVRPDLIVVDLMMPVMDGLRFIQWLRQTAGDTTTPVLVFSTVQDPKIKQEVLSTGANFFAGKPMHLKELVQALNGLAGLPRPESRTPAHE
jgi:two-component system KDP operon response regulator KdpE